MEKYCYLIADIVTEIDYDTTEYTDYLEREFGLMKCNKEEGHIKIAIRNKRYEGLDKLQPLGEGFFKDGKNVVQVFKAFKRSFVALYKGIRDIELFIPYSFKDFWGRLINPYYESRAVCCLEDFFHNPFLLILQLNLLHENTALFHCSSFLDTGRERFFALSGEGRTGKTTILKQLVKKGNIKACSEDFAFVNERGMLYGYTHLMGVKTKHLEPSCFKGFGNKLNRIVFEILTKKKNVRHFPFREIIEGEYTDCGKVQGVLFLDRNTQTVSNMKIDLDKAVDLSLRIITREFSNVVSLENLTRVLLNAGLSDIGFDEMVKRTETVYKNFFENVSGIYETGLPMYEDAGETAEKLNEILAEI